ncbi:MAG: ABC-F family ATP-binding cassette domain-containing protein [Anaerolineae bacterium]|jgi:ATP-binding cassette subfamily F protein 3|nr:ABC-F family ATP-binding cassette domain-containing protein [Anaerolineae bacterium]
MTLLIASQVSKFYGAEEIFSGISAEIPPAARIALVGPNGAGKTTLVNLLIGTDLPTEGSIQRSRETRIAFLPQRPELVGSHTLWEEQLRAFAELRSLEARLHDLADRMADPDGHDAALAEYSQLQPEFEHRGGYTYETRIRMVLTGVGFKPEDYTLPLTLLSGGQKTRALLARLLLEEPDLLVLDEPTNHLDIQAVEWLEDFLQKFPGAVLAISHDRYFIDHFASTVWELDFGQLEVYRGNYSQYTRQREERRERLQKEFEQQQAFLTREQDYIRKHMGSRWTAQAKGRLKKLETLKKRGKIIERGPRERREMNLRLQEAHRSGNQVLVTQGLAVGYADGDAPLFHAPDVVLLRGETVAIIGANGAGKSTLLRTLLGTLPPLAGRAALGAGIQIGYFAQAHEGLNPANTLIDEITRVKPMAQSEARSYLGAFMFSGDDVFRTVETLSGGERGRLALAKLALDGANVLLLDEPTNHLDIEAQEILQDVLEDFHGTILLVSHDRYLIDRLATQIWQVERGRLEVFDGTYQEYVAARRQRLEQDTTGSSPAPRKAPARYAEKVQGLSPYQLKKRIAEIEAEIDTLEQTLAQLHSDLEAASATGDAARVRALGEQYTLTEATLNHTLGEWEKLAQEA